MCLVKNGGHSLQRLYFQPISDGVAEAQMSASSPMFSHGLSTLNAFFKDAHDIENLILQFFADQFLMGM